jgi:tetratricopeptide (TPR) repeat protein
MLAVITNDPSVPTDDPSVRPLAQALMIEGVKQLQAKSYEQALANFLEAYAKFPSPKILLNIGSTLRDMGRLADAANTYQRYLADPATGPERIAEGLAMPDLEQACASLVTGAYEAGGRDNITAVVVRIAGE